MTTPTTDRRSELLTYSRALLRTRGFNAFSHRDLADLAGVKSSSVHYHFPTKDDLGLAVLREYRAEVLDFLKSLDDLPARERLNRFAGLFSEAASGEQWCVAGMLASDFATFGEVLQIEVRRYFDEIEGWLSLQAREMQPELKPASARRLGKTAMALLEGALLLARSQGEPQRIGYALSAVKMLFESG